MQVAIEATSLECFLLFYFGRSVYCFEDKAIPIGSLVSGPPPALKLHFLDLGHYTHNAHACEERKPCPTHYVNANNSFVPDFVAISGELYLL